MESLNEICIICEHKRNEGIYVQNRFICDECEKDMVNTETNDPKYIYYLKQLKKIEVSYF
ncbi:sigma factor G inhibitor Gin [Bacillus cytotoxicus]|uniref:sigma factor G inhibitor Gin n=1 Tax=unclassified Bacillus cereus group TaxID=2750818 RepID=UPI001F56594B|nr:MULTISPECIES: sigma factor G inhibitor Gin [unclassified Bacillus cereus group]EMA6344991.1 sigma factor G inhibitor Gin [Bacillus cytotoxicus]